LLIAPVNGTCPFQKEFQNETEMRIGLAPIFARNPCRIMLFGVECSPAVFIFYTPAQQEKHPALKICNTKVNPVSPVIAASARFGQSTRGFTYPEHREIVIP